jgi:cellulose synthase/poly-beta-1,6-N-acetylglucosamine synthase-like glycosyltransferase
MIIFGYITLVLIIVYSAMLFWFAMGWKRIRKTENTAIPVSVTVIVPARNEAANIQSCLHDLLHQDYPQQFLNIVVVDDGSDDETASIAEEISKIHSNLQVLRLPNAGGKKQALQQGIMNASTELIATVDADCRISPNWISSMVARQQSTSAVMVLGPVVLTPASTLFERIQQLEFLAIMGITGGAASLANPIMANGANLLFSKKAFIEAGGYSGTSNPSGDDVFLMLKIKSLGSVVFAKDARAVVSSKPMPNFSSFWQQRKRWLSKKGSYSDWNVKSTAVITYLANVSGLLALIGCVINLVIPHGATDFLLGAVLLKTIVDYFFIRMVSTELLPTCGLWHIILAQLFILIYTTTLGILGNVSTYEWKGRKITVDD